MKLTSTNIIILLLGIIISLVSYIFISKTGELENAQAATASSLVNIKLDTANRYGIIDSRLARIEMKLGIPPTINMATTSQTLSSAQ